MSIQHEHDPVIAIVGATGLVGREALAILEERGVPAHTIRALASERSSGTTLPYARTHLRIDAAEAHSFDGVDIALFCADARTALLLAPYATRAGATVIDNSSAFRHHPDVPLVVPEINAHLITREQPSIIANPNCSTIILLGALEPLRRAFGIDAVSVATYQAVSGAGIAGIEELQTQLAAIQRGTQPQHRTFPEPCALNVFSHDSPVDPDSGINGEEQKIIAESRRIWDDPFLRISPTCLRVPVLRAHTQAISIELSRPAREEQVRAALHAGKGLRIIDDRASNSFPTPLKASHRDEILVGRIRPDPGRPGGPLERTRRWSLLVSADQLRKGAALNAIQIADAVLASRDASKQREVAVC